MEAINDYELLNLYFSAECQLNCTYCYVAKNHSAMVEINKKIREDLVNGNYINIIKTKTFLYKNQITTVGLWGAEPYINLDLFGGFFEELMELFPNLHKLQMSSNMIGNPDRYNEMFHYIDNYCKKHERNFNIDMQISIDGPESVTDTNRGIGTTQTLMRHVDELFSMLENFSDNISFYFHSKTTVDLENIRKMADSNELTFNFFKFFDDWVAHVRGIIKVPHAQFCFDPLPTFAAPIKATKEDGEMLADWYRKIRNIKREDLPNLTFPLVNQILTFNLKSFINGNIHFNLGNCGAGYGAIGITPFDDFSVCHHLFHHYYEDRDTTIVKLLSSFDKKDKEKDWYRFHYINRLNSDFIQPKWTFHNGIMALLSECGQIDKKWFEDEELNKLAFVTILSLTCKTLATTEYSSQWLSDIGTYRLFLNGAIDELIKYYRSCGWWEKIV